MRSSNKKVALFVIAAILLFYVLGIRVVHPKGGLSNGLGSAASGLVLYKTGTESVIGTKVIVDFSKPHESPILAAIASNQKASITVQTGSKLEEVQTNQIRGRLLVMVPFLGELFTLIGK
jgi:hypothetical protein